MAHARGGEDDYATSILTLKQPEQAALILPHAIDDSTKLLKDQMIPWLSQYLKIVKRHTDSLRDLSTSAFILNQADGQYGALPRIFKCVNLQLAVQISNNDSLLQELHSQVLAPLIHLIDRDARFLALMIYSEELRELAHAIKVGAPNAELDWSTRAPSIFDAFAEYKDCELKLVFDVILNFFQAHGIKWQNELDNNQSSVEYLLKTFDVSAENKAYFDYAVGRDFLPLAASGSVVQQERRKQEMLHRAADTQSLSLDGDKNGGANTKTSKLKSRMGSIFGRRKNRPKTMILGGSGAPAISEETGLVASPVSYSAASLAPAPPLPFASTRKLSLQSNRSQEVRFSKPTADFEKKKRFSTPAFYTQSPLHNDAPDPVLKPLSTEKQMVPPPAVVLNKENDGDSPNFVRYASLQSSSSSASELNGIGRKKSLLEKHHLTEEALHQAPHQLTRDSVRQAPHHLADDSLHHAPASILDSRHNISVHSFEAGDEREHVSSAATLTAPNPPMPPPSRKVVHPNSGHRAQIVLQMFENLPASHELMRPPPVVGTGPAAAGLVAQNTGNTMSRGHDFFRHADIAGADAPPGLSSSIAQVMNVTFKGGELVKAQLVGEVAFAYSGLEEGPISVTMPKPFSRVILNGNVATQQGPQQFSVSPLQIRGRAMGAIKYLVDLDQLQVPVFLQQVWRHEPHQLSLMISVRANNSGKHTGKAKEPAFTLHDLVVSVALDSTVQVSLALSKPQGLFSTERNRITWRYSEPLELAKEEQLIARFLTNGTGSEHESGLQIKFRVPDHAYFDAITVEGQPIPTRCNIVSGSYVSHS